METRSRTTSEKVIDNELFDISAQLDKLLLHDPNTVPPADLRIFASDLKHVSAEYVKISRSKSSQLLKNADTHEAHEENSRRHNMRDDIALAIDTINTILRLSDFASVSQLSNVTHATSASPFYENQASVRSKVTSYLEGLNDATDEASRNDTEHTATAQRPSSSPTRSEAATHQFTLQLPKPKPMPLASSNLIETARSSFF